MDPFNAPALGAPVNLQTQLSNTISQVAPLATSYHGAQTGVEINQNALKNPAAAPQGVVSKFAHFIGGVGSEIGSIAEGAGKFLATSVTHMATSIPREVVGIVHGFSDRKAISTIQAQTQHNSDVLIALHDNYKAGRITAKQYQQGLITLGKATNSVVDQNTALDNKISADQTNAYKATIDSAAAAATILTAGFGGAASIAAGATNGAISTGDRTAAEWLVSKAASSYLGDAEGALSRVASDPELFNSLPEAAQQAMQKSAAEIIAGDSGNMTAAQLARASATNLALKYPIYYSALSTTGQQIYKELDQKKYGAAMRTLAFNAALLLSGGPIGQAIKAAGAAGRGAVDAIFGRTSFIDELSKGIGDGSPDGLFNAINAIDDPTERQTVIKQMSSLESTNLGAVDGKDPTAAAWRVLNGMSNYEGVSMNDFTHEQALDNMVNFAKAQQLADDTAQSLGIKSVTVGRVDAGILNRISALLSPINNVEDRLNAWDALKAENPNTAWANNDNFDRQVKALINKHESSTALDSALRNISASSKIAGFPKNVETRLAKMGYIPISPVSLEAPFKEGSGELASKFTQGQDFFTKAVQPLSVLSSMGALLTNLGLSPQASGARVYQLFNDNLSANIQNLDISALGAFRGESEAATADNVIKTLSNYAKQPTRGGIDINGTHVRPPITDLRQLTTNDVKAALGVGAHDAQEVKAAIMDSMLQVPLTVRGLGDRIADVNYKINPLSKSYARIQGAARFAWNPIFKAKLAYKTEILSQAVSGGKVPTILGTNKIISTVFPEYYNKIDSLRDTLRDAGVFEKKGPGSVIGGEGVADGSAVGANLTHKLLPSQERSIASMVATQADKVGLSPQDFVTNYPEEIRNTVQMIAQYDRNASFLNSPMARTLNFAFFPFRFETKVATIMAQSLAKTDPMTQFAVIKGVYNASNFLKSPEGMAWYSKNSDVIGLMKYFTPLSTLSTVAQVLGSGGTTLGAYGELGGLPFGWIPQLLDAEGLTHFGVGYVDAKSGDSIPSYVPSTALGQLSSAIQDLIGSLFTYPGATAGLPSKTSISQNIAMGLTTASKTNDFTKVQNPISAQQQQYQQTIEGLSNTSLQASTQNQSQLPQSTASFSVPQQPSSLESPLPKRVGSGTAKKKKAQFTPELLPGQTQLGQL